MMIKRLAPWAALVGLLAGCVRDDVETPDPAIAPGAVTPAEGGEAPPPGVGMRGETATLEGGPGASNLD